jgi:aryl-alcohol dehydrogenase-like predicted oxidoreductase
MIPTAGLGCSGAAFTRLGLGTWAIGAPWRFGWGPVDDAESIASNDQNLWMVLGRVTIVI